MVGPKAPGAVLSQDLDGEARCDQALWGFPQLHVEVLPQAAQSEVDCFTAASSISPARVRVQGSAPPPALVVCNFMGDVNTLVVNLVGRYNLIFWRKANKT